MASSDLWLFVGLQMSKTIEYARTIDNTMAVLIFMPPKGAAWSNMY